MSDVTLTAIGSIARGAPAEGASFRDLEHALGAGEIGLCGLDAIPQDPEALTALLRSTSIQLAHVPRVERGTPTHPAALGLVREFRRHGIAPVGHRPPGVGMAHATLTRAGTRIGVLGYSEHREGWCWRPRGRGNAFDKRIIDDVRAVRARADVVVVCLRWGVPGARHPTPRQMHFARLLIDSGAHVVLGHGPGVPQGIERRADGLIAYSLGALGAAPDGTISDVSLVLTARVSTDRLEAWEVAPLRLRWDGSPEALVGDEADALREHVERLSDALATGAITDASFFHANAWRHLRRRPLSWDGFARRCVRGLLERPLKTRRPRRRGSGLAVEVVEADAHARLTTSLSATPFVTPGWLEAFRRPGRSPLYLRFRDGDEVVGGIGGLRLGPRQGGWPGLTALQTLFCFSGPAVGGDRRLAGRCVDALCEFADARRIPAVVLGSWDHPLVWSCRHEGFETASRQEYILRLDGDRGAFLKRMSSDRKKWSRVAQKAGLAFGVGRSTDLLAAVRALSASTRARRVGKGDEDYDDHYMPHMSDAVVESHLASGIARVAYVERDGTKQAAVLVVVHGTRAHGVIMGISPTGYRIGAGDFLILHVMETLADEGLETLNLGGIPKRVSAGLRYYKASLGAVPHTCTGGHLLNLGARVRLGLARRMRGTGGAQHDGD